MSFFSNLYINCSLILHHLNFWKTDCELYYVKINHNVTLTLFYNNRAVGKSCLVVHDNKLHYFSFLWKYTLIFFLWIGILGQCVCSIYCTKNDNSKCLISSECVKVYCSLILIFYVLCHRNYAMRKMPMPINDAVAALQKQGERTEIALQKVWLIVLKFRHK